MRITEEFVAKTIAVLIAVLILAVIAAAGYGVYYLWDHRNDPPPASITLVKSEWACTSLHRRPTTVYVKAGDTMIPITNYTNECFQWSKQP